MVLHIPVALLLRACDFLPAATVPFPRSRYWRAQADHVAQSIDQAWNLWDFGADTASGEHLREIRGRRTAPHRLGEWPRPAEWLRIVHGGGRQRRGAQGNSL